MVILRFITLLLFCIGCFAKPSQSPQDLKSFYRTYWYPVYHGTRLSYCATENTSCGTPVATSYCQMMGYDKSVNTTIDYNVGLTRYLGSNQKCKGWTCNGFILIRCVAKTIHEPPKDYYYRSKNYVFPRFNHYRIDWCYKEGKNCGKRVALSFCRRMGYMSASHYQKESHVAATRALGDQRLCFGEECNGFSSITCYR